MTGKPTKGRRRIQLLNGLVDKKNCTSPKREVEDRLFVTCNKQKRDVKDLLCSRQLKERNRRQGQWEAKN